MLAALILTNMIRNKRAGEEFGSQIPGRVLSVDLQLLLVVEPRRPAARREHK